MAKKKTSLVLDEDLWQEVKIHCIKEKKDISDYLNELIKKDLNKNEHNTINRKVFKA